VSHVSTYLNFAGTTEAAFEFYKFVFGTEYVEPGIMRHGDVPMPEGAPALSSEVANLVMNVQLPIMAGHLLMGTDVYEGMGMTLKSGNNFSIVLHPDSRAETDELFRKLSAGGTVGTPPQEMFWGAYYADLTDKFGIQWSLNCNAPA
jgi:PhnB protein